ncbi:MAG: ATP-binding protein, partial [Candidatus Margulisiibacteriota bacterium]
IKVGDEDLAEIVIADNGCGISNEDLKNIFDPFFTNRYGGTGLGLTVVHGIIESHGGSIDVESKEGEGTVFTIKIPSSQE